MPITELNHVNLRTPYETMLKLKDFYCDVVGLKVGPREGFSSRGFWLYINENDANAVVHLAEYRGEGEPLNNALTTLDHFRLRVRICLRLKRILSSTTLHIRYVIYRF